jgi:hypothetical protein
MRERSLSSRGLALALSLAVLAGCGRVGDPLPPFVRIPEPAVDFAVSQDAYNLLFQWTSPARNVDFSASTDLAFAEVLADGDIVGRVEAMAGLAQALEIDARGIAGVDRVYVVRFVTEEDRLSQASNAVPFTVVEVPEGGVLPAALVDQGMVRLTWTAPSGRPELATAYRVYRTDDLLATRIPGTRFDDTTFEAGLEYRYRVVPLREVDARTVEGAPYETLVVEAVDRTPPGPPLNPDAVTFAGGAFLRWEAGPESDLALYRIYRLEDGGSDDAVGESATTGFNAVGAESGAVYAITAVDGDGNESGRSTPVTVR